MKKQEILKEMSELQNKVLWNIHKIEAVAKSGEMSALEEECATKREVDYPTLFKTISDMASDATPILWDLEEKITTLTKEINLDDPQLSKEEIQTQLDIVEEDLQSTRSSLELSVRRSNEANEAVRAGQVKSQKLSVLKSALEKKVHSFAEEPQRRN